MPTEVKGGETLDGTFEGPLVHGVSSGVSGTARILGVTASGTVEASITNATIQQTSTVAHDTLLLVVGGTDPSNNVYPIPLTASGGGLASTPPDYISIYEDLANGTMYFGQSVAGNATSAAAWRVARIVDTTSPTATTTLLASSGTFDQIWDNRAALSYT